MLGLQGVRRQETTSKWLTRPKPVHIADTGRAGCGKRPWAERRARITLDQLHEQLKIREVKNLPIVIKADVQGSVEVLSELAAEALKRSVKLKIIHPASVAVTETTCSSLRRRARSFSHQRRPDRRPRPGAAGKCRNSPPLRNLRGLDEIKRAMTGLLEARLQRDHLGRAEVRDTFRIKGLVPIAGCMVPTASSSAMAEVRLVREGVVVYKGKISFAAALKDDASEVRAGLECGVASQTSMMSRVGDVLECFSMQNRLWRKPRPEHSGRVVQGRSGEHAGRPSSPDSRIHLPDSRSLKDKRQVLGSLKIDCGLASTSRLRSSTHQESWQRRRSAS